MDRQPDEVVAVFEEFESLHKRGCVWGAADQCFVWGNDKSEANRGVGIRDQRTSFVFGDTLQLLKEWHKIFVSVQTASPASSSSSATAATTTTSSSSSSSSSPTGSSFALSAFNDGASSIISSSASSSSAPVAPSPLATTYLDCSKRYRETLELFLKTETEKVRQKDPYLMKALKELSYSLEHYSLNLNLLETLMSLWHITDMLFVDPARNITPSLIEWVQRRVEPPEVPLDANGRCSPAHSEFWPSLARLTLLGHYGLVIGALQSAGVMIRPEVRQGLEELFRLDPSLSPPSSEMEYRSRFQTWQEDVAAAQDAMGAGGREEVGLVLSVLRGDPFALQSVATCWEERFIAQVRFCRPHVLKDGLWRLAESCGDIPQPSLGLELLCCSMERQEKVLQKTLVNIMELGCPRWLTVHLLDLLSHAIPHPRRRKKRDAWRERELLEYGTSIMQHPQLWNLAIDYFLACPSKGLSALRALIEVQPLKSDVDAAQLLSLCEKFEFPDLRQSVCNQRANAHVKAQRYGEAALWMCVAQDEQRLAALSSFLCDMFVASVSRRTQAVGDEAKCAACGKGDLKEWSEFRNSIYHSVCLEHSALSAIGNVVTYVGKNSEYFNLHYHLPFLVHFQQLCENLKRVEELQSPDEDNMGERTLAEERKLRSDKEEELEKLAKISLGIVVRALSMKVAPRQLWFFLLHSSVRLLETAVARNRCVLNQADTFKLMSCLDELALSHRNFIKDQSVIKVIRLGLTRNLSCAIKNGS